MKKRVPSESGAPYDIPDLRREEDRLKYENDRITPFYGTDGSEPTIDCSSRPRTWTQEEIDLYDKLLWGDKKTED